MQFSSQQVLSLDTSILSQLFGKYALLGDDIIIADPRVANAYQSVINALGVTISLPKSLISDIGGSEFAKFFRICYYVWIFRPLGAGVIRDLDKNMATRSRRSIQHTSQTKLNEGWTKRELHERFQRVKILLQMSRIQQGSKGGIGNVDRIHVSVLMLIQDYKFSRGKDKLKTIESKTGAVRMKSAKMCPADESRPRPNMVLDR
ncbi:hypothetical protein M9H77_36261 [Catharanthus roseus]|uniref:Uncharacterized protein n=1 Tax=Catharanthus roseus TaxID=4058 RepID=A0ACB9ZRA2_CATRO|nr:hypothetical protein M9H77_36261 [Catharanthus roseus]